jgi:colanic acid biosynthesis protein WcaH
MSDHDDPALARLMEDLEARVPDARAGLPDSVFFGVSRLTPLVNVDLLVVGDHGEKLLTWRHDRFYGPGWHVPGGIIRFKERLADRAQAVARLELGAEVEAEPEPLAIREIMHATRDVRGHFISVLLRCKLCSPPAPALQAPAEGAVHPGQWRWFEDAPGDLIPQHAPYVPFLKTPRGKRPT